ncbi:MAG: hypothetical protein WC251_01770 [Candidatus Izemoplasmatales bacterium]|jgi:hypothetical protein
MKFAYITKTDTVHKYLVVNDNGKKRNVPRNFYWHGDLITESELAKVQAKKNFKVEMKEE